MSRLLLDTHTWIWLLLGIELKPKAVKAAQAAASAGGLCLAAISVWEVAMLEAKGRLTISGDPGHWVEQALGLPGLSLIPLEPAIALDSARLPGDFHGDPADRLIVATARQLQIPLATRDRRILAYGREGYVQALEV